MAEETGSIDPSKPPGRPRTIRTKEAIKKMKRRLQGKKQVSTRKLAIELSILSRTSIQRILKSDLGLRAYKKVIEPRLTGRQKIKRKQFAN